MATQIEKLSDVTLDQVKELLPDLPDAVANRPFIEGDHFQEGDAWVGPGPRSGMPGYSDFLEILEPSFVSKNVMDEAADRLSSAIIGWEPRWAWVPRRHDLDETPLTDEEDAAITELESAMTDWWDGKQVHKHLGRLAYTMLWAKEATWRLYVPAGLTDSGGRLRVTDLSEAFAAIYIDIPEPEYSTVWEHPDTKALLGIVVYRNSLNEEKVELCFLAPDGRTVIKVLPEKENVPSVGTLPLGKHLTIYKVSMDAPLITEQVRSLQKQYNMTLTLLGKGLVDNHFLERFFLNALPPGGYEMVDDGAGGKKRGEFIPITRMTGGRTDSYIRGIDYQQPTGDTVLTDPEVVIRNPLDPQGTIGGANFFYQAILEEVRQDHILINQLATPSGRGREQARGDFIDSTKDPQLQVELAGRELLLTAACMVEAFMGTPGKWTKKFKPVFKCRPNYGPLSVQERTQNMNEAKEGFKAVRTAISENGTDDVEAEMSLIDGEPTAELAMMERRAKVADLWALVFPRDVALHLAGFDDEQIAEIMKRVKASNASLDPNDPSPPVPVTGGGPKPKRGPTPAPTSKTKPPARRNA